MRGTGLRWPLLGAGLFLVAVLAAMPSQAGAAVRVGSALDSEPDGMAGCLGGPGVTCLVAQTALRARQVASPSDGVVVRVRIRGGAGMARARVLRPLADGSYMLAGASPFDSARGTGIEAFEARLPVSAGDLIGLEGAPGAQVGYVDITGARGEYWEPAPADGASARPTFTPIGVEYLYQAVIEPDADLDGFGDETQDFCPDDASTQEPCLPPPSDPVAGRTATVEQVRGEVFVKLPRARSAARAAQVPAGFVPLTAAAQIPVGSIVDAAKGTVRMTAAADLRGEVAKGDFTGGRFRLRQKRAARPTTELRLRGDRSVCRRDLSNRAGTAQRRRSRRRISRLRGDARGRFRTRGRYGSATVRGTRWTMDDRCDGTLTVVQSGTVQVRDFARRSSVVLRRGERYLARPGR